MISDLVQRAVACGLNFERPRIADGAIPAEIGAVRELVARIGGCGRDHGDSLHGRMAARRPTFLFVRWRFRIKLGGISPHAILVGALIGYLIGNWEVNAPGRRFHSYGFGLWK